MHRQHQIIQVWSLKSRRLGHWLNQSWVWENQWRQQQISWKKFKKDNILLLYIDSFGPVSSSFYHSILASIPFGLLSGWISLMRCGYYYTLIHFNQSPHFYCFYFFYHNSEEYEIFITLQDILTDFYINFLGL